MLGLVRKNNKRQNLAPKIVVRGATKKTCFESMHLVNPRVLSSILFYHQNREKLQTTYGGRYLLLVEESIVGHY
ncbi:MAG: hypothetical protein M3Q05_00835, partial [Bacteroidota bacterium]|nr:hypothetical protein [Bacteroidota bacterium]